MSKRKSQSILEYIIIFAAITVAVIAAAGSIIKPTINTMMKDSASIITEKTGSLRSGLSK